MGPTFSRKREEKKKHGKGKKGEGGDVPVALQGSRGLQGARKKIAKRRKEKDPDPTPIRSKEGGGGESFPGEGPRLREEKKKRGK